MLSLKSFLLGESLSYENDYVIEDNSILKYKNKYDSNSDKKYLRIATFKASGKTFYCSLIQNRFYLEPHFGVFFEGKYEQLKQAIKNNDEKTIKELMEMPMIHFPDGVIAKRNCKRCFRKPDLRR